MFVLTYTPQSTLEDPAFRYKSLAQASIRWLINLPKSFDEYLAGLSSNSRQSIKRKMRKPEHELRWKFKIISSPEQVEPFLRDARW